MSSRSETVYHGAIVDVHRDDVCLPNGNHVEFEIVRHPGGAAIVALDTERRVCLIRQYRHALGQWLWELPAGKLDGAEPPRSAARRELLEEAGVHAEHWRTLGKMASSPGIYDEIVWLYLATGLSPGQAAPEAGEVFSVHWVDLAVARGWIRAGLIIDAKTSIGLSLVQ
jgi:ADP-ribose pyrophosphatase